jgi:ATP:ADP antiporter, AAA family
MSNRSETDRTVLAAIVSAGAMIAFQVGGKATRDAVFLSNFPVTTLPMILLGSAVVSLLAVLAASRLITRKGPSAIIPIAFAVSSILLFAEWMTFPVAPRATVVAIYLHMAGFGAILVSGFWSIISELFDPRTAKAEVGRIAAGGTLGGLLGGVIAERTGTLFSVTAMLPVLASFHLTCAVLNRRLQVPHITIPVHPNSEASDPAGKWGFHLLKGAPYLKHLAVLVMLSTIAETLLDYVFKAQALGTFSQGQQLIRFFAFYYTGISLITFLIQAAFSRHFLQQFGLTPTISTLPLMVTGGGLGALLWPGLLSMGFVRGAQAVLRSSLFRSGYELLYAPVAPREKRAAKTIVDVGFDKMGDAVGAGLIRVVLAIGLAGLTSNWLLTFLAVILGVLSFLLTMRLSKEYVSTLESSLLNQAANLDLIDIEERTTRLTMLRTLGTVNLRALRGFDQVAVKPALETDTGRTEADSTVKRILDLQSENANVVRAALSSQESLDSILVAPVIRLLARDEVSEDAVKALRTTVAATVGQLTDALLNAEEDFAVRRRIPRVLAYCPSIRAVEGLMRGLADVRFEVRFSCGRGLSRICSVDPTLRPQPENIYTAALEEIAVAERLSERPRVLDRYDDHGDSASSDALWDSTDIRLEHIFRLLSLCLPREPLHVAFQALHTDDTYLRGTALEYLESILPPGIRENFLRFLEGFSRPVAKGRPADHIAAELMQSRDRIERKLALARTQTSSERQSQHG